MAYPILKLNDLSTSGLDRKINHVISLLHDGNFAAADVKKMKNTGLWRAKLDDTNRLIFRFGNANGRTVILILEVIRNHAYDKSRFLANPVCSEADFVPAMPAAPDAQPSAQDNEALPYVNEASDRFHILDRILSFDPDQDAVFDLHPPLIIIGSAGSGKTVLLLEKMKELEGRILYVTHSAFLVESSRNLFYAQGYRADDREIDFYSFGELLQSVRSPEGREATWRDFQSWFNQVRQGSRLKNARMLYEEVKGVITGSSADGPFLSRDAYLALGVKQSILNAQERGDAWDLFDRYRKHLLEHGLWDSNIAAATTIPLVRPQYDALVIDEVQDFTTPQLAFCLKTLIHPTSFVLSGDSNQIVHPNFFSWARVKSYFYLKNQGGGGHPGNQEPAEIIRILRNNYRNSIAVTEIANRLLKIKQQRFGSIDKESNYLVTSRSTNPGTIEFLADNTKVRDEINRKTGRSTKFAVITLSDEIRDEAKKVFDTPLVFSVHEAKGLEYDNVVLFNMVSSAEKEFRIITEGVAAADLGSDLDYSRGKNKEDKTGEAYKFYSNALYVAMTRSRESLFIVESRPKQPLLDLLGFSDTKEQVEIINTESSIEDWQKEAHKLDLQGKADQAADIRQRILKTEPVPWEVMDDAKIQSLLPAAFDGLRPNKQAQRTVFEFAVAHDRTYLLPDLIEAKYTFAKKPDEGRKYVADKYCAAYRPYNKAQMLSLIRRHGLEHLTQLGDTPLLAAIRVGNLEAVRYVLEAGADMMNPGTGGRGPLALALALGAHDKTYAKKNLGDLVTLLMPGSINIRFLTRMRKLDPRHSEHQFLIFMVSHWPGQVNAALQHGHYPSFSVGDIETFIASMPESIVPSYRKVRAYLSSVLAKNEVQRQTSWNRNLFLRVKHGLYMPNPLLEIQVGEEWKPFLEYCGLDTALANSKNGKSLKKDIREQRAQLRKIYTEYFAKQDKLAELSMQATAAVTIP